MMTRLTALLSLLCAASIIYGLSVRRLNSGTSFYLVWIALGGALAVLIVSMQLKLYAFLPPALLTAGRTAGLLLFLLFLSAECLIAAGFRQEIKDTAGYLIVLGAQVDENGPRPALAYRLARAAAYLEEHPETVCIVSGGKGYNEPSSEASVMKEYLLRKGIDEERILEENRSRNTSENITFSMELMKDTDSTVGIVTNNFHVFRAVSIARKKGLKKAFGLPAQSDPFYLPNNMLREFFGVVKDAVKGNL